MAFNGTGSNVTSLNASNVASGTLAVARGGTGAATLTANNVLLGNGTSALQVVAPGSNGNILTSNGTTWTSAAPSGGGVTSLNGQTGAITNTTIGAIGSYQFGAYLANTEGGEQGRITYNTTVAGSNVVQNVNSQIIGGGGALVALNSGSYYVSVSSGTWRCMTSVRPNPCCGAKMSTLWVRIS